MSLTSWRIDCVQERGLNLAEFRTFQLKLPDLVGTGAPRSLEFREAAPRKHEASYPGTTAKLASPPKGPNFWADLSSGAALPWDSCQAHMANALHSSGG